MFIFQSRINRLSYFREKEDATVGLELANQWHRGLTFPFSPVEQRQYEEETASTSPLILTLYPFIFSFRPLLTSASHRGFVDCGPELSASGACFAIWLITKHFYVQSWG